MVKVSRQEKSTEHCQRSQQNWSLSRVLWFNRNGTGATRETHSEARKEWRY